ncbi:hypothetical protein EV132_10238 [Rhizobium sullae]|uniref:Uncharacterized protein n=1 Tax=Rhizobium sullae TaxID=50338 RepID=A0A4R3QBS2_RHISU|nr:hypothetical protein EV132_10238 [Rhizobium sullae]
MIRSFKDAKTEAVASGKAPKGFPADLVWPAVRKLMVIETACIPEDIHPMSGTVAHDGTRRTTKRYARMPVMSALSLTLWSNSA